MKESDPRYVALRTFVGGIVKSTVQGSWAKWRTEHGAERALQNPAIKEWFQTLEGDNKKLAKQLFGKIESLTLPDADAKKEIYRQAIVAFETLALKSRLSALAAINDAQDLQALTNVFSGLQELEAAHYYQL